MIYFDNAATTPVLPEVKTEMYQYMTTDFWNPSGSYSVAHQVSEAISDARSRIAETINCSPEEIYFTGSGSEADNWAIKGFIDAYQGKRTPHIITTEIEHHAILNACKQLEQLGRATVSYIPVDNIGIVSVDKIRDAITKDTVLVSCMMVNNEIGTLQPIHDISSLCREKNICFHTDAVQAYGKIDIDVHIADVDMMSVSGHKIGCCKGIGFLYKKNGVNILPLINGGQQEFGLRAGTENVPYIIGLAKAAEIYREKDDVAKELRDYLYQNISQKFPELKFNGDQIHTASGIINIGFGAYGIRAEELLAFYDQFDICISSGSACNSHSNEPSHVLKAIGLSDDEANCSIRVSFGCENTKEEVDIFIKITEQAISVLGR